MWLALASGRALPQPRPVPDGRGRDRRRCFAPPRSRCRPGAGRRQQGPVRRPGAGWQQQQCGAGPQLGLPVVLVIDARGMTRGVAPLILGYQAFDREIRIAGVILNRLGGSAPRGQAARGDRALHRRAGARRGAARRAPGDRSNATSGWCRPANWTTRTRRVRAIGRSRRGAGRPGPRARARRQSRRAAGAEPLPRAARRGRAPAAAGCASASRATAPSASTIPTTWPRSKPPARELVPIDTLHDARLPALDGLFIGGGFPEVFMAELEANAALRAGDRARPSRPACRSTPNAAG